MDCTLSTLQRSARKHTCSICCVFFYYSFEICRKVGKLVWEIPKSSILGIFSTHRVVNTTTTTDMKCVRTNTHCNELRFYSLYRSFSHLSSIENLYGVFTVLNKGSTHVFTTLYTHYTTLSTRKLCLYLGFGDEREKHNSNKCYFYLFENTFADQNLHRIFVWSETYWANW